MTRVSLTEAYDDRSVISKLNEMDKRVKENASVVTSAEASARQSAQSAQETADRFAGSVGAVVQNANAQINASKAQVDQAKAEVDETVTTVAQAVQTAEGAVTTANAASASAQQSAQTVAGYNTRLTAAEGDITALQGRMGTAEGNITALQNVQADYVKKAGAAQTVTSQIMVPTTATGTRDTQIANGTRIQNDLDNYPGMIRTTGNQTKAGGLTVYGSSSGTPNIDNVNIYLKNRWSDITQNTSYNTTSPMISFIDNANNVAAFIYVAYNVDHTATLIFRVRNSDGSYKTVFEQKGDVIA